MSRGICANCDSSVELDEHGRCVLCGSANTIPGEGMAHSLYEVSERFKSVQGEGLYAGTPMAFIRFVGCSVGKKICAACDTDFEKTHPWRGGGVYKAEELLDWARPYTRICLTGGEPLNQDLTPFIDWGHDIHIETSGTVLLSDKIEFTAIQWLCVSPKPGFLSEMIELAHEIKVIVPSLGPGDGWPSIDDALGWAHAGKMVYLQPRNLRHDIDQTNLRVCQELVREYPELRLSVQMHKVLGVS